MLSPAGSIRYSCPECGSTDLKILNHNPVRIGGCNTCKTYFKWSDKASERVIPQTKAQIRKGIKACKKYASLTPVQKRAVMDRTNQNRRDRVARRKSGHE